MKAELLAKYLAAMETNPRLFVARGEPVAIAGYQERHMELYGLGRRDLKALEKLGYAMRGYTKNYWAGGETLPNGRVVPEGAAYRSDGHRVVWVLLKDVAI